MISYDVDNSQLIDDIWKQKAIADQKFKHKHHNLSIQERDRGTKGSFLANFGPLKSFETSVLRSKKPSTGYEVHTNCSARKRSKMNKILNVTQISQKFKKGLNTSYRRLDQNKQLNISLKGSKNYNKKRVKQFLKSYFQEDFHSQRWKSQRHSCRGISLKKRISEAYNINKRLKGLSRRSIKLKNTVRTSFEQESHEKAPKMFKTTRRSIQPSRRRNNKVFMKIDKQMDNDLYHITIKRNFRGKKLTISAKNDRNTTKRADFKINLPRKAAKEMLKSKFDGSFANLTDNLCIKNRRLLLINPKANLENLEN
ncbi:unnamed protein product [Moneuplotes crassus]|uniref:Uncharacterized protein n=1 Tax=Euplotes crassus TaxID=5936 RepID=A0AAD1XG41_EUPCR|nr:unnamed protein product [Moneuplotes crassus]